MPHFEVRIAGMGGQGIIMAAVMIGRAASIFGGKYVTLTQSYGPESRGGACKAEVIVSDERVDYPKVRQPSLIAIMSEEAYRKNISNSNGAAVVVIDPDMVEEDPGYTHARIFRVPATRMAEGLGKRIVANMVMVGAIVALTNMVEVGSVEKAIAKYTPRGTEKLNVNAFRNGYEFARKLMEKQMVTA
jgi:2-oxoglutarate ferredoxin oxidoreductase subunit gamma